MLNGLSENREWKEGYPNKEGWYDCLVDGEEVRLRHFVCCMSGRHEWADERGDYVYEEVMYCEEE